MDKQETEQIDSQNQKQEDPTETVEKTSSAVSETHEESKLNENKSSELEKGILFYLYLTKKKPPRL